jgi:hypothetical protein
VLLSIVLWDTILVGRCKLPDFTVFDDSIPRCEDCGVECPNITWDLADKILCPKCYFDRMDMD